MLGFKNFNYAAITIAGVELLHRIRKGSICPTSPTSQRPSCACDLECSPCCINHCLSSRLNVHISIFAPAPPSPTLSQPSQHTMQQHGSDAATTRYSYLESALTPLIWEHVNPYGRFDLDMNT